MNADPVKSSRFYSLDALRGVAALCVVFWHWQHFFYAGTKPGHVDLARLPFERWFHLAYVRGELAVDLFFCLSGFIFYWLYADRVSRRTITGGHFAWLRFSRLYPLHLATLALVAVGQRWMMKTQGCYFVYDQNDKLHFAYNLFLVSGWGVERGFSFNGPIWSVSVEVFLYGLFFAACRLLPVRAGVLAGLAALGRGMLSFFYRRVRVFPVSRLRPLAARPAACAARRGLRRGRMGRHVRRGFHGRDRRSFRRRLDGGLRTGGSAGWLGRPEDRMGMAESRAVSGDDIGVGAGGNPAGHVGASPCFSGRRFLFVVFAAFPLATGRRDRLGTQRGRCGRVLFPWIHGGVFRGFAGVGSGQLSFFRDARAAVLAALGPSAGVAGSGLAPVAGADRAANIDFSGRLWESEPLDVARNRSARRRPMATSFSDPNL
jgi:hypothetical protein